MHRVQEEGDIDLDFFRRFLTNGVPLEYPRRFLPPLQIEVADVMRS